MNDTDLTEQELDKLKAEINYRRACGTCVACGECDTILKMAIEEKRLEKEGKAEKPCNSCRL
jgi:hypothetical protein